MKLRIDESARNIPGRRLLPRAERLTATVPAHRTLPHEAPREHVDAWYARSGPALGVTFFDWHRLAVDDVINALLATGSTLPPPPHNPMSADRVRWEHIQRVYELCGQNVSETARRLNMHRRTLQRILAKRSPK